MIAAAGRVLAPGESGAGDNPFPAARAARSADSTAELDPTVFRSARAPTAAEAGEGLGVLRRGPTRPSNRGGRLGELEDDDTEAESELDPGPFEPVVSANAIGAATTADPTPRATANAPTRPM